MNIKEENKKLLVYFNNVFHLAHEVGKQYHEQKESDIGIVKLIYLGIAERVMRNMIGISSLLNDEKNDFLEKNRQPIMLLLRGIIEDLTVGLYLLRLKEDVISFENEVNVITLDYAKFSEYLIKREPKFSFAAKEFKDLSEAEIDTLITRKLGEFRASYDQLYKIEKTGEIKLKKPIELRVTSNPMYLKFKKQDGNTEDFNDKRYTASLLNDIIEIVGTGSHQLLELFSYSYLLYKVLSQYQHFTHSLSKDVLNKEPEFEYSLITKSVGAIHVMLYQQLQVLGINEEQNMKFCEAIKNYTF